MQVGFQIHKEGHVELDPVAVFSKLPIWPSLTVDQQSQLLETIPSLIPIAAKNGVLTEQDFASVGLEQTPEEKALKDNHPRDEFPLHRHRAVLLTSKGSRDRLAQRKEELETKRNEAEKKKEREKEKTVRLKRMSDGWKELYDPTTKLPVRSRKKIQR